MQLNVQESWLEIDALEMEVIRTFCETVGWLAYGGDLDAVFALIICYDFHTFIMPVFIVVI